MGDLAGGDAMSKPRDSSPFGFGWDKVITILVTLAAIGMAAWTGYLAVWAVVMLAYFAGGFSFELYLEWDDDHA